jgi:SAM-dependent methyltransferase
MQNVLPTTRTHLTTRSNAGTGPEYKRMRTSISDALVFHGVRPQCPRCRANIEQLECPFCGLQMQVENGIVKALLPDREAHFLRFMKDYERIRAAEGRWSEQDDYYLSLPYRDVSGKNVKQWEIRGRSFDYLMKHILKRHLPLSGGRILDIGAGNCWMSYRLALANYRPFAVDLLTNNSDGIGAAEHYRKHLPAMFPRIQAELCRLPFQDGQFDGAIFNASFHYAEDYVATLREALRCVKNNEMVIICDTPWYSREESGRKMVAERNSVFLQRFGTASDSIKSLEYLTDERLRVIEQQLGIQWTIHYPSYGFRWAMRPLVASLLNRREPSRFRIYATRKA